LAYDSSNITDQSSSHKEIDLEYQWLDFVNRGNAIGLVKFSKLEKEQGNIS
jgi:hypothetical protein